MANATTNGTAAAFTDEELTMLALAADVRPDVSPSQLAHELLRRWRRIGSPDGERQREGENGQGQGGQLFHAIPYDGIKPRNDWGPACLLPCEQAVYRAES